MQIFPGEVAPSFRAIHGMRIEDAVRAWEIVKANQKKLLAEWRRIHGY